MWVGEEEISPLRAGEAFIFSGKAQRFLSDPCAHPAFDDLVKFIHIKWRMQLPLAAVKLLLLYDVIIKESRGWCW